MTDFDSVDYFKGTELIVDPYPYFDHMRDKCPVAQESRHGVFLVTGYDEAIQVFNDTDTFSSCNASTGPFPGFKTPLAGGDDVSADLEARRDELPFNDQILTFDPPKHTDHRGLLMRLITPKRLAENEQYMNELAERQISGFIDKGECEYIAEYASPFALLVIADLLGIPEEDRPRLTDRMLNRNRGVGNTYGSDDDHVEHAPLAYLYDTLSEYVADRRQNPRNDVITGLATATFPDGSMPEIIDAVRIAANLFAAGQETTVRLLSTALMYIGERPELQARLRAEPDLVPNFVEECLRIESPVKGDFRLARKTTTVAGTKIPAGSTVMVMNGAGNRDPRKFDHPNELRVDRANARHHLAFGRGPHTCPGAPLARAEAVVSISRILDRTGDIRISERVHGPKDARRYTYIPTHILRGLTSLTIEFDKA
jgi:cytochrome P450